MKRSDNRKKDDLRPIKITTGVLTRAQGSCYLEWGQNKALVAVYGPREALPAHKQNPKQALVNFTYRMTSFSVPERKNPKPARREMEIGLVLGNAVEKAIFVERFPNMAIDIFAYMFDSNAGTRCAALTAASVALADAGIPMRDLIASVSVGKANGEIILDLTKEEEDAEDAVDVPVAIMPSTKEIVLLQMDGLMNKKEFEEAINLAITGCIKVNEMQKEALKNSFKEGSDEK